MTVDEPGSGTSLGLPGTISQPARRALDSVGITSLQELATWPEQDIANLHGMGPKGLRLLKEAMARHGLSFRQPA